MPYSNTEMFNLLLQFGKEFLCDAGYENTVIFENPSYLSAVVGVTDRGALAYDMDAMVESLMIEDGMSEVEAVEFIEYNTVRALPYIGEYAPVIIYNFGTF